MEIQVRNNILVHVRKYFPEVWEHSAILYGISPCLQKNQTKPGNKNITQSNSKSLLLISGLDDPGYAWQDLAPILIKNSFNVSIFTYPNDQSIEASTEFLYTSLAKMQKTDSLSMVCHSMGGLLAKNLLTRPDINYSNKVKAGFVPRIDTLIMIGTPHQGSHLARFRIFLEIRDQLYQWHKGNKQLLNCLMDGTGSAGIQLLPNSLFLKRLNERELPSQINTWVISGRLFPFSGYIFDCIGDGLVTIDSAKGRKMPSIQVSGSHLGMLRNNLHNNVIPSAIPVILNLLPRN